MAKLNVASKGITKNNEYWLRVTQESEDGFIDTGFLSVTKALYDKIVAGKPVELSDARAARVKWEV